MSQIETKTELLVVGGGLGGLLTAARAAKAGRRVTLLEQAAALGGFGRSPELGGANVNLGPHALYLDGPAERALLELGVKLEGFIPGAGGFFDSKGELLPMPTSALSILTASWLSWRERVELALAMREVLGAGSAETVGAWLARRRSERVRLMFSALIRVTTYCNAPDELTTKLAFRQLQAAASPGARGVLYLDGGWQRIVDQLETIARELGVEVRTSVRVSALEGTTAVLGDGTRITAQEIALAVPAAAAAKLSANAALERRVAQAKPVRAACLDLVLRKLPRADRRLTLGFEEPTYFSVHSPPAQSENIKVHVAWYLAPDDHRDAREVEQALEAFVDRVQPGWRDEVVGRRYFPHMRVMEDVPREAATPLDAPLHFVSGLANSGFLFDAVASASELSAPRRRLEAVR
ncbi:MAG: FAD-dependent oxidoreductase [Archangium sp.]